eukprot:6397186-Prymnesium_polylepis.1
MVVVSVGKRGVDWKRATGWTGENGESTICASRGASLSRRPPIGTSTCPKLSRCGLGGLDAVSPKLRPPEGSAPGEPGDGGASASAGAEPSKKSQPKLNW